MACALKHEMRRSPVVVLYMILMPSKVGAGETAMRAVIEINGLSGSEAANIQVRSTLFAWPEYRRTLVQNALQS